MILISLSFGCVQSRKLTTDVQLKPRLIDGSWYFKGINLTYGFIDLRVLKSQNDSLVNRVVIPPLDSVVIMEMGEGEKLQLTKAFNEKYDFDYFLGGDPFNTNPDLAYEYMLPFRKYKWYEVIQGPKGSFSHNDQFNLYAVDFKMESGEPVYAARDGVVIKAISHFKISGGKKLKNKANRIVILHDDGTTASYVHLNREGVLVKEGQDVSRGELIGYSGNTGFSSRPHLHFVVRKEEDLSIPIYFEGYADQQLKKTYKYRRN